MSAPLRCCKCDSKDHDGKHCPSYPNEREAHSDAQFGDTVRHMDQVDITISADGAIVQRSQRKIGWFYKHKIEMSVGNVHLVLGSASGEGCNCLIYSFQKMRRKKKQRREKRLARNEANREFSFY